MGASHPFGRTLKKPLLSGKLLYHILRPLSRVFEVFLLSECTKRRNPNERIGHNDHKVYGIDRERGKPRTIWLIAVYRGAPVLRGSLREGAVAKRLRENARVKHSALTREKAYVTGTRAPPPDFVGSPLPEGALWNGNRPMNPNLNTHIIPKHRMEE